LRPLDFQPVSYQDQQMWLVRDPLELTDYQLILPPTLAQILVFCDGTRDIAQIQTDFSRHVGVTIDESAVADTLAQLDAACLLDNERSRKARQIQLEGYRCQPYRPPSLAGLSYPADPDDLRQTLTAYGQGDDLAGWQPWHGRGIISPHIDYQRGGPIYAKVWQRAAGAVNEADLVLIFGTDHNGSYGSITLTHLPYATPYGTLPTDSAVVAALADALGPEAFTEELHHRKEHSVELSAVWFRHMRGADSCPVIPILCGSFHHFVMNDHLPAADGRIEAFLGALGQATAGRRVLAIASVDLAHVGPTFGDSFSMDAGRREKLASSDRQLMSAIASGDAAGFYQQIASIQDRNRVCGFSSIYLMLRFLGPTRGIQIAYEQCPADAQNTSLVSICGLLLD
jgi:MEMO1 family protein